MSTMRKPAPTTRNPEATRAALVDAARREFEEAGYDETNTNKIAARAGFAPQTFYRHFENKAAIFIAVYERWVDDEGATLDSARDAASAARAVIAHHRAALRFRRALRRLAVSDDLVRAARARSRIAQVARLKERLGHLRGRPDSELIADLLTVERVADACAEGEFADVGMTAREAEGELRRVLRAVFGARRG
jgi:AcrR family transcriptional regulator